MTCLDPTELIPWQEILKRHLLVIDDHRKILNTVRKQSVPTSDYYHAVSSMLDQCSEMNAMATKISESLGASLGQYNANVDINWFPAHHDLGRFTTEAGTVNAHRNRRRRKGTSKEINNDHSRFTFGLRNRGGNGASTLSATDYGSSSATGDVVRSTGAEEMDIEPYVQASRSEDYIMAGLPQRRGRQSSTNSRSEGSEEAEIQPRKKSRRSSNVLALVNPVVQHEDISEKVDQRLKEKEELKKVGQNKKRKRRSQDSLMGTVRKKYKSVTAEGAPEAMDIDGKKHQLGDKEAVDSGTAKKKQKRSSEISL